ncbi:MAG TPA: hypothetical protein VIF37_12150 [Methylobacter sp.]|jgi:hypothetical protein
MKNYRLFLLNFVMASFILLTGFQKPSINRAPLVEKQVASGNVKTVRSKSKESLVKQREKKDKRLVEAANSNASKDAELQKSLDFSIPFKVSESTWLKIEPNKMTQEDSSNMFTTEKQNKPRPVDLDGQMLMSQEPEVDKRKSLDGAGIVITLKR